MKKALLISTDKKNLTGIETEFAELGFEVIWTDSALNAIKNIEKSHFDLVIVQEQLPDMSAKELIEKILFKNAMINSVVLSSKSKKDFHEVYEGLGVLMQFPVRPVKQNFLELAAHIERINALTS